MSLSLSSTTKSTVADDGDDDVQEALPQLVERLRKKIALKGNRIKCTMRQLRMFKLSHSIPIRLYVCVYE